MKFIETIVEELQETLEKYDFLITKKSAFSVQFESTEIMIFIVHNNRERSNSFYIIDKKNNQEIEMSALLVEECFDYRLKYEYGSTEEFSNDLFKFFNGSGEVLLIDQRSSFKKIDKAQDILSKKYTDDIMTDQNIKAANQAWKEGNNLDVVRSLSKVEADKLTSSLKKKLKISLKRISN